MDEIMDALDMVLGLGLESRDITVLQMGLRAAVVFIVTILMVRLAKKQFMGRATAFDVILGITFGSIVSRALTGNSPLLPALAAQRCCSQCTGCSPGLLCAGMGSVRSSRTSLGPSSEMVG
jgi:hypothetical protein